MFRNALLLISYIMCFFHIKSKFKRFTVGFHTITKYILRCTVLEDGWGERGKRLMLIQRFELHCREGVNSN